MPLTKIKNHSFNDPNLRDILNNGIGVEKDQLVIRGEGGLIDGVFTDADTGIGSHKLLKTNENGNLDLGPDSVVQCDQVNIGTTSIWKRTYGGVQAGIQFNYTLYANHMFSNIGTSYNRWSSTCNNFVHDSTSHDNHGALASGNSNSIDAIDSSNITPGSGYTDGIYYINVTGGTGGRVKITVAGGVVTAVKINRVGYGYTAGTLGTVLETSIPGGGSGFDAPFAITDYVYVDFMDSDTWSLSSIIGTNMPIVIGNLNQFPNRTADIKILINQGSTPYVPSFVELLSSTNSTVVPIKWLNGNVPIGTASNFDYLQLKIINWGDHADGSEETNSAVLGQLSSYRS